MRRIISFCLICLFCFGLTACGPREHRVLATTAIGAVAVQASPPPSTATRWLELSSAAA